ncbi:hypothetical protein GCM10007905_36440 [Mixta theicola]|nr:hypothetical protein GCM10007905_36440 [Mixta theicola]
MPGKYKYIAALSARFPVPEMTLVTEAHLNLWLANFCQAKAEIDEAEQHIAITSGAFLTDDLARIERSLNTLCWRNEAPRLLSDFIRPFDGRTAGDQFRSRHAADFSRLLS